VGSRGRGRARGPAATEQHVCPAGGFRRGDCGHGPKARPGGGLGRSGGSQSRVLPHRRGHRTVHPASAGRARRHDPSWPHDSNQSVPTINSHMRPVMSSDVSVSGFSKWARDPAPTAQCSLTATARAPYPRLHKAFQQATAVLKLLSPRSASRCQDTRRSHPDRRAPRFARTACRSRRRQRLATVQRSPRFMSRSALSHPAFAPRPFAPPCGSRAALAWLGAASFAPSPAGAPVRGARP